MNDALDYSTIRAALTTGYIQSGCQIAIMFAMLEMCEDGQREFKRRAVVERVSMTRQVMGRNFRALRSRNMVMWDGDGLVEINGNVYEWTAKENSEVRVYAEGSRAYEVLQRRLDRPDVGTQWPAPTVPLPAAGDSNKNRAKKKAAKRRPPAKTTRTSTTVDRSTLPPEVQDELQKLDTVKSAFDRAFPKRRLQAE